MILPKELFDQIDYFEHSFVQHKSLALVDDIFVLHFKAWYRLRRTIRIARVITDDDGTSFNHTVSPSAADLYSQLNNWATETWDEKLDAIGKKYEPVTDGSNVVYLKPKPKMDDK